MVASDIETDLLVVGSGAAGMTAAAVAAAHGLRVMVVEKTDLIGGTTAISGGMVWIPCDDLLAASDPPDSVADARRYLDAVIRTDDGRVMRERFLDAGPRAVAYLARHTAVRLRPLAFYPDYYPDLEGFSRGRRVLEPEPFDGATLGSHFARLRPPMEAFTLFGGMMVAREDIPHLRRATRSPRSFARAARLVGSYGLQRLRHPRGTRLVLGNALAGRLLKSLVDRGVPILTATDVRELTAAGGRIDGAVIDGGDGPRRVRATRGVVLATGGFSHDPELRRRYLPAEVATESPFGPGSTGDGLRLGVAAGAVIDDHNSDNAYWTPASVYRRRDGAVVTYPHTVTDRGKPGSIVVDAAGRRFTNEAVSYHRFVQAMLDAHARAPTIPACMICDRTFLWRYGLGAIRPFTTNLRPYLEAGYLIEAPGLGALATRLGIDGSGLEATVTEFNADARTGVDRRFARGADVYSRYLGDGDVGPNPCLAPLEIAPYYAIRLVPSDLGTVAGLRTDVDARVLDAGDRPVPGLYAAGGDMRSIMCGRYPGPGITLGPALTFGYLAGVHAAGSTG
ncbi:MAG: FAD-dependent oxidoreductase [Ectothiorhodospiraceae bacterium]|nr:FAD-dependent oxidoreductase [Ectothiorhodospiraceae bacterium]